MDVAVQIAVSVASSFLAALLMFLFTLWFYKRRDKKDATKKDNILLKKGLQSTLMMQLCDKHDKYIKQGYASFEEKNIYEKAYKSYHDLGQNGVMTKAYEEVMNLPTERPKKNKLEKRG